MTAPSPAPTAVSDDQPRPTTAQRHHWLCAKLAAQADVLRRIGEVEWAWLRAPAAAVLARHTEALLAEVADQPATPYLESRLAMRADAQRRHIAAWHEFCAHDASTSTTRRTAAARAAEQLAARAPRPEGYLRRHLSSQARTLAATAGRAGDTTVAAAARTLAVHADRGRISTPHAVSLSARLSQRLMRLHLAAGHHDSVPAHLRPDGV